MKYIWFVLAIIIGLIFGINMVNAADLEWTDDLNQEFTGELILKKVSKTFEFDAPTNLILKTVPNQIQIIKIARKYLGVPYVWGGNNPSGFDCSGFVQYVYRQCGKNLPRVTTQQEHCGKVISINQAQAGDLYFWGNRNATYHVAIACGDGKFIQAPAPGQNVMESSIDFFRPSFAVRLN